STVIYRINALTGKDYIADGLTTPSVPAVSRFSSIRKILSLPIEEADDRTQVLALIDADVSVHLFPNSPAAHKAFRKLVPSFHFYLTGGVGSNSLEGYIVAAKADSKGKYATSTTWSVVFPEGEKIAALPERQRDEPVASLGRVLGNRSVLYKYLNPALLAVPTLKTTKTASTLALNLIDTVTGTIHHRSIHDGAGNPSPTARAIHVVQSENWVEDDQETEGKRRREKKKKAATAAAVAAAPDAKSFEIVALEIYESQKPDVRVEGETFSSFNSKRPHILAQAYSFPHRVTAVGVTTTGAGITSREVLFGLTSGHLYGINRRLLDPRRPIGPPSADDKEEGLIPYRPILDFNPVPGITRILSTPTSLESTSLVVAYGLDVFFVRRAPSKAFDVLSEDFNHVALVATIAVLIVAIYVSREL
ncbi:hypothetical protein BDK51DRAFT_28737, partial [Blyttiomyces helicus]